MDRFAEDDDNVESFLSHDDTDPRDAVGRCMDDSKGVNSKTSLPFPIFILLLIIDPLRVYHTLERMNLCFQDSP